MTVGSPQEERGKSEAAADVRRVFRAAIGPPGRRGRLLPRGPRQGVRLKPATSGPGRCGWLQVAA
jgi:hypothetical protein